MLRIAVLLVISAWAACAARAEIRLVGVLMNAGAVQLGLTDTATGALRWQRIGSRFAGHTIVQYDPGRETVLLVNDSGELRLRLAQPKADYGTATLSPAQVADIHANLHLLWTAFTVHRLEGGGRYVTFDDLVGPGKHLARVVPVAGEDYSRLTFMKGEPPRLAVTAATGENISLPPPRP